MKKAALAALAVPLLVVTAAHAVELGPVSLGFHLNPALEATDGVRSWGLSISLSADVFVGAESYVELTALVDSAPSSLGATVAYHRILSGPFTAGAGLNMFWSFENEATLVRTVIGSYAHAAAQAQFLPSFSGEIDLSFPLVSFARQLQGWEILPLAELPSAHLAAEWQPTNTAAIQGRLTLQPVIIDTTQFDDPIGRINDDLLVLPTYSAFLRYMP